MPFAIIILILILVGIAIRNLLPFHLPIWLLMLMGAVILLMAKKISLIDAWEAINFEIIFYLFGVFVIAEAMESSGLLERFTEKIFNYNKSAYFALFIIVFVFGLSSALLMNDAIAIIGTPIVLKLCQKNNYLIGLFLLALAYSITIGSVLSPLGNPQNLLIAVQSGMSTPFLTFLSSLAIPTLSCLLIIYLFFIVVFRSNLQKPISFITVLSIKDMQMAFLTKFSFLLFVGLICFKIILELCRINFNLNFSLIALISALPILFFSKNRITILKNIDWRTLVFFVAMFIVMKAVWNSDFFQNLISKTHFSINNIFAIMGTSVTISQVISNVPLVALYVPLLKHAHVSVYHYLSLAVGSTLAGNIFIFGAASNMIIIQSAEKRGFRQFNLVLFSLFGIPLTIVSLFIYAAFLNLVK